jgi:hypothetical protein
MLVGKEGDYQFPEDSQCYLLTWGGLEQDDYQVSQDFTLTDGSQQK